MIKKVIAVIILIAVLSAFLVIFGGIAILDISIKLMWLSFSAIIAFACKSLGWNISQEIVNKLLAKHATDCAFRGFSYRLGGAQIALRGG